jgi:peptidoglycan/LPS O-acetylase OafA/YrhL
VDRRLNLRRSCWSESASWLAVTPFTAAGGAGHKEIEEQMQSSIDSAASSGLPRLRELDALRGLASAIVVLSHFDSLWVWETKPIWLQRLLLSPLRLFVAGHEAVILFFLLSGLALTIPYLQPQPPSYFSFLVKRVFRIYVPYVAALMMAVACAAVLHGRVPGMAPWLNLTWSEPVNANLVFEHLALVGSYNYWQFNGSFWTLIHEMRISIVFPALCLLLAAVRTKTAIVAAVILSGGASVLTSFFGHEDWFLTLHYAAMFLLGALIALNLDSISRWFSRLDRAGRISLGLSSLLLFTYGRGTDSPIQDWAITLGALGLVILSLNSRAVRRCLMLPALQRLGQLSYSTYLIHLAVLLALVHGFGSSLSTAVLFLLYVTLTAGLAFLFHYFIEQPAADAGRSFSQRVDAWTRSPRAPLLKLR